MARYDATVDPTDRWIGTDDADGTGTPAIIHYLHGPGGLQPSDVQVVGDNIFWEYNLTVPAGETVRLAHFTILGNTRTQVEAAADTLVANQGFGEEAAAYLTPAELASLANFVFNTSPTITSNGGGDTAAVSVPENTAAVTTVTATDPESPPPLAYSILGGADAAAFSIDPSTGVLAFVVAPDYENPADAGGDNLYNVTVQASDGAGGTDTQAVAVTVADATGEFSQVESIQVDKGTIQRSMVRSLTVTFDKAVDVSSGAFSVVKRGAGGGPVVLNDPVITTNGAGQTVVTLTFAAGAFRGPGNSLIDGNYQLTIDTAKILSGGEQLDGDGNNAAGGNHEFGEAAIDNFFRLFGDGNKDRLVNSLDLTLFSATYGKRTGQAGFNDAFDYDGDGDVDGTDLAWFRGHAATRTCSSTSGPFCKSGIGYG